MSFAFLHVYSVPLKFPPKAVSIDDPLGGDRADPGDGLPDVPHIAREVPIQNGFVMRDPIAQEPNRIQALMRALVSEPGVRERAVQVWNPQPLGIRVGGESGPEPKRQLGDDFPRRDRPFFRRQSPSRLGDRLLLGMEQADRIEPELGLEGTGEHAMHRVPQGDFEALQQTVERLRERGVPFIKLKSTRGIAADPAQIRPEAFFGQRAPDAQDVLRAINKVPLPTHQRSVIVDL